MYIPKSHKMHAVHYDLRGPISDEAERMERAGIPVVKLNTGNPAAFGFEPPQPVLDALAEGARRAAAYTSTKGTWAVREAVVDYCAKRGVQVASPERIYTGNGVSELILLSLQALLNPGDEVLVPQPDYPLWTAAVRLCGGVAVHYRCEEDSDWLPDADHMARIISPRTRAIVVINPNNPTGAVYPRALLARIAELARRRDLLLMSDEIYDRLLMDGYEHVPMASVAPDLPVITYGGLSKSHQLCGYRCGWMALSGELSGAEGYLDALTVLASMRLCSNALAQAVIPAALAMYGQPDPYILPGGRLYEQREVAWRLLTAIPGVRCAKAKAGLYMFPGLDSALFDIEDDEKFVLDFLRAERVLLTHGRSYNWPRPDHFRVVHLPDVDSLSDVLGRLGRFLDRYRRG